MLAPPAEISVPTPNIEQRINRFRDEIRAAALRANRDPEEVRVLAVSKQKSVADIRGLLSQGFREFGESYVVEALPKLKSLASAGCTWHYVGVVQSNKTKKIAQHFDWVQSIDRVHIGKRLAEARKEFSNVPLNVCIQVNIDDEPTKAGVAVHEVAELVQQLQEFSQLQIRGLMAIPNPNAPQNATRLSFRRMRAVFDRLQSQTSPAWDTLSMGMSADYTIAIEEGTTMVRIGTALMGPRT